MPVTSVPTSSATVAIATFITEVSSVIRNWPAASVRRTRVAPAAAPDPLPRSGIAAFSPGYRSNATRHAWAILPPMDRPDPRRRSRSGQMLDGLIWGAALGAASGAVLGDAIDGVGAWVGALAGAVLYAAAEVLTT